MNKAERRLAEDRANRNAARKLFDSGLAQVQADVQARGIGGRIKAKATDEAAKALEQGVAVARESKGIVAATIGALALWFLRGPLIDLVRSRFSRGQVSVQEDADSGSLEDKE